MRTAQLDTAIEAYHAHVGAGRDVLQRARIIAFISSRGGDWSIGEIARALELEKSTVSARLNEMLAAGQVVERPRRKDRIIGITVRPVGFTSKQGVLFS